MTFSRYVCPTCMSWMALHPELRYWRKCLSCGFSQKERETMDLTLNRQQFREDGVFGELLNDSNEIIAYTLEHAYKQPDGSYLSKIPNGTYTCQRGQHQLEGMAQPFITFEITGIEGHSQILFHFGNWAKDSAGCVLLGESIAQSSQGQMITDSKVTFKLFMQLQDGIDQFQLTVL